MSWSRCSNAVVVGLLVLALFAPVASAVSVTAEGAPEEAQIDAKVSSTFTFTELYGEYEEWTLHGETNLTNVTWTVTQYDQAGNQVSQQSYDGSAFDESVALSSDTSEVRVKVTGTVPAVENFSYDPPQRFRLAAFEQVREGGTNTALKSYETHHYTEESRSARQAIDDAAAAVEGSGSQKAERNLEQAIEAYNSGNFDLATDLASDAQSAAQGSQQTQLIIYAVAGLVVLALVVGGVAYWWTNRDTYDELG